MNTVRFTRPLVLAMAMSFCASAGTANTVSFRIDVDDRNLLYLADSDTVQGTQITPTLNWTNTGTFALPLNTPRYLHVYGLDNGGNEWAAATFTAPVGTVFAQTGSRTITTNSTAGKQPGQALWSASTVPWTDASYQPWNPAVSPTPAVTRGTQVGVEGIWSNPNVANVYFSTQATLEADPNFAPVAPVSAPQGLSIQLTKTTTGMSNLADAQARLALRPGDAGYYVSQVRTINQLHIESDGHYAGPAGYLLDPSQYAARITGYVYAPTDGYVRTFAAGGDDGYRLTVGGQAVILRDGTGGVPNPHYVGQVYFPTAGYYPLEVTYFQGGGGAGLEVSSREGYHTSWNSTDFAILGSDANFAVYQRPDALPANAELGAQARSGQALAGPAAATGDGLRAQVLHYRNFTLGDMNQVEKEFRFNQSLGNVATVGQVNFNDGGAGTSYHGGDQAFPGLSGSNDNFLTRASGLINITEAGTYSFAMSGDDGLRLNIAGQTVMSRNGFNSAPLYGHFTFTQPGLYPVEMYHNEGGGGASMEFSMQPVNLLVADRSNPAAAGFSTALTPQFFTAEPVARLTQAHSTVVQGAAAVRVPALGVDIAPQKWALYEKVASGGQPMLAGLKAEYYSTSGSDWWNPASPAWTLRGTRVDLLNRGFDFPDASGPWGGIGDNYAVRWSGYLQVNQAGTYSFLEDTDDLGWLNINGQAVITEDGTWSTDGTGSIFLGEGLHAFEFFTREFSGGNFARLQWMKPGDAGFATMPAGVFWQEDALWMLLAEGTNQIGDSLLDGGIFEFDYGTQHSLRLWTEMAGQVAMADLDFRAVPEPLTLSLLALSGAGLAGYARRRRRT